MSDLPFTWDRPFDDGTIRIKDRKGSGVSCAGLHERQLIEHIEEANKLLEQTIEVLEGFEKVATADLPLPRIVIAWWRAKGRPLLTNLKGL